MHIHHGARGPGITFVDAIAMRINLQRAIEVRAFLHRAFAIILDAAAPEYSLALVVRRLQFEPGIVGIYRTTGKEMADFLGADHDIDSDRISAAKGRMHTVQRRRDWKGIEFLTRNSLRLCLFADRKSRRQIRLVRNSGLRLGPRWRKGKNVHAENAALEKVLRNLQLLRIIVGRWHSRIRPGEAMRMHKAADIAGVVGTGLRHVAVGALRRLCRIIK